MRFPAVAALLTMASALAVAGCGASAVPHVAKAAVTSPGRSCPKTWSAGWQKLANRIDAPVYCPGWLPAPLTGVLGGPWNNIDSVSADRSYLMSFVWQERGQEIHINLRGYPGRTRIPICRETDFVGKKTVERHIPCFADPNGTKSAPGITATMYTVSQDADQWHVLYAWHYAGGLYTVSEHVAPPFGYGKVRENLDRMLRGLVVIRPTTS